MSTKDDLIDSEASDFEEDDNESGIDSDNDNDIEDTVNVDLDAEVEEENDEEEIGDDDDDDIDDLDDEDIDKELSGTIGTKPTQDIDLNLADEYLNDSDDESTDENYLQKFNKNLTEKYINENHPEVLSHNFDEISKLMRVVRNDENHIIDPLHKTLPFLTKFEKTRIIGQRAKQIETGSTPFIKVPDNIMDGYLIAELELQQKKIPFIIRRPIPNGTCEYWDVNDLENVNF